MRCGRRDYEEYEFDNDEENENGSSEGGNVRLDRKLQNRSC
jgi:hypothetical protein